MQQYTQIGKEALAITWAYEQLYTRKTFRDTDGSQAFDLSPQFTERLGLSSASNPTLQNAANEIKFQYRPRTRKEPQLC